ncbi:MAG TPA: polyprenyl synthetase family protein [Thermoprotei archaeon]|nr:polyprenyl synthetase family protein [Thermoprotei archaeon]
MSVVAKLIEIGHLVDPVMEEYLKRNLSKAFEEAVLHQIKTGGKRVRPALTLISCEACGGSKDDAMAAAAAIELTHNYSLILDDIIDHSEFRRNFPTVWKKYGLSTAILVAVHYRESISEALNDTLDPKLFNELLAKTIKILVDGERLDILFEQSGRQDEPYVIENRYKIVTLDDYLDMVYKKTGSLLQTACVFGALSAKASSEIINAFNIYGKNIGNAFQIGDDILDLFGEEKKIGKKVGKDIIEHKMGNILITLTLEEITNKKDRDLLISILRKDRVTDADVSKAIEIISKTNAKKRAENMRDKYVEEAIKAINILPESTAKNLLVELAKFISTREY